MTGYGNSRELFHATVATAIVTCAAFLLLVTVGSWFGLL